MLLWPPPWPWILCLVVIVAIGIYSLLNILRLNGWKELLAAKVINHSRAETKETTKSLEYIVFNKELWQACHGKLHPRWLLLYRGIFGVFFAGITVYEILRRGLDCFFFFTQWNFFLLTAYFGMGTSLGSKACYSNHESMTPVAPMDPLNCVEAAIVDLWELESLTSGNEAEEEVLGVKSTSPTRSEKRDFDEAGASGYIMQVVYQICLPMAVLVDVVLWAILFPEAIRNNNAGSVLNFVSYTEHGVNFLACLGDCLLNSMRYPWFRVSYIILWSLGYIVSQWILHDGFGYRWAYNFLDNVTPEAPLWYLGLLGCLLLSVYLWVVMHKTKERCFAKF